MTISADIKASGAGLETDPALTASGSPAAPFELSAAEPNDYFALMKPRVMRLVVFTALVGMIVAPGAIDPVLSTVAIISIAIGAGASGALNMWYDADIDAVIRTEPSVGDYDQTI